MLSGAMIGCDAVFVPYLIMQFREGMTCEAASS